MQKIYSAWIRDRDGLYKVLVRAENFKEACDKVGKEYPTHEVETMTKEDKITEII